MKTSSGRAKPVKELPSFEIVCPVQNFQKSLLRRALWAGAAAGGMTYMPRGIDGLRNAAILRVSTAVPQEPNRGRPHPSAPRLNLSPLLFPFERRIEGAVPRINLAVACHGYGVGLR